MRSSSLPLSLRVGSSSDSLAFAGRPQRSSSQSSLIGEGKEADAKTGPDDISQLISPESLAVRMNRQVFEDNIKKHDELVIGIQKTRLESKLERLKIQQSMNDSTSKILNAIAQSEERVKSHITAEVDKMTCVMEAHLVRLFADLDFLKAEVKKSQFSPELARIRDVVRILEERHDEVVDFVIASSQVEDLPQQEYTEVHIEDRVPNKQPYRIGERVYFLNQNVLTMSGQLGPQIEERYLGQCFGKSIGGTWKDNIRMYVHNSLLSYVIDEIMYFNRKYDLSLEIKDFTKKELQRPPPMSKGAVGDFSRAKIVVKGCVVCGMNLPTDPVKQKCQNCKGKPRGKSGICTRCHKWGYFEDSHMTPGSATRMCADCKPQSCCTIM